MNNVQKILGIDIDGVITDEGEDEDNIWFNALCNHFGEEIERKNDVFDFREAYNLTEKEMENFIKKNIEDIYKKVAPVSEVKEILRELKELGFTLILITARDKKFHELTLNWLKKHKIPFDKLIHEENKAPLACENNIELFIEDNKENTIQLIKYGIPVIVMDKYHNKNIKSNHQITIKNEKIFRAHNWYQVKNYIYKFFEIDSDH